MLRGSLKQAVTIKCLNGVWKVNPNMITVQRGGTIEFQKPVDVCVHVQVSEIGKPIKIGKRKKTGYFKVPLATRTGFYPYAVFCCEQEAFCTGSSMPIIIVPPPPPKVT